MKQLPNENLTAFLALQYMSSYIKPSKDGGIIRHEVRRDADGTYWTCKYRITSKDTTL